VGLIPAGTGHSLHLAFRFECGWNRPAGMSVEFSYVGHLSHRLLVQEDLAMPLNLRDKNSGANYFQAAQALAKLYQGANPPASTSVTPQMVGPTAAYWSNILQPLAAGDAYSLVCSGGSTPSVLQAVYDLYSCYSTNETTALGVLDFYGSDFSGNAGIKGTSGAYYGPIQGANTFFNRQFHSLYAWRSVGNANYHAMQVTLRKRMSKGVQFDFNYAFSKSIDLSSDAERIAAWGGLGGEIINSWNPNENRGISDFDTTHQINANWIVELPFGNGKRFAGSAHGFTEGLIGGWQLSGLTRWTTGFPVNIGNGATWPTNWQLSGNAIQTGPYHTHLKHNSNGMGAVNLFPDPQGPTGLGAFRHAFPGESGQRNTVRGLALHFHAELLLVNIVPVVPTLPPDPNYVFKVPEYERYLHMDAEKHLSEVRADLIDHGVQARTMVGHGSAADEIVAIADREHADLIVIATHGSTGLERLVFGSVAERVVRLAKVPVLTVRQTEKVSH